MRSNLGNWNVNRIIDITCNEDGRKEQNQFHNSWVLVVSTSQRLEEI